MSDTANQPPVPSEQPLDDAAGGDDGASATSRARRRRGSRGGRSRSRSRPSASSAPAEPDSSFPEVGVSPGLSVEKPGSVSGPEEVLDRLPDDLPDPPNEGRPSAEVAQAVTTPYRPQIGDSRPGREEREDSADQEMPVDTKADGGRSRRRRRRGGRGRSSSGAPGGAEASIATPVAGSGALGTAAAPGGAEAVELEPAGDVDVEEPGRRRGRERKGRPVGRYLMCVHGQAQAIQIGVLEGRVLIEHYVSRPQDDALEIHGNIYLGRVQNVLPGMEAAFVDIGTPKNAVLYRGDVQYDPEDVEEKGQVRIEHLLRAGQTIVCQVTKNPIGTKGARLTQEVSLPGRFVVLVPNSETYGISKRLHDDERKRLRKILDEIRPEGHGLIVRTAAEGANADELRRDVSRLLRQWEQIEAAAKRSKAPALLYREPAMAVRVIREEFNKDYRGVVIDEPALYEEVRSYVESINPELADRVQFYDPEVEPLPIFERYHVHEQLHKALDRKVWLPSGGSLIIERTEALTVIDVNTGKNVGRSSLEETVFRNNLEAAEEIARQLRLRDIGGIIVIDFIDMEVKDNRDEVVKQFRAALARDKTKTQVFDISELGLVEMTRKRISEGLVEAFSAVCPTCNGRGIILDESLL